MKKFTILLSFDLEEFDTPLLYGKKLLWNDQVSVSKEGTEKIMALLNYHQICATFYSTVSFAKEIPELIEGIAEQGHELASHGMKHSKFIIADLAESKIMLEKLSGRTVYGYRMARMMPVDETEVYNAGYLYNSSLNPTFIPGRYNNLKKPRKIYFKAGVCQFPTSVSTFIRMPLFWLSFHNLPFALYKFFCKKALREDGYLHLYFHPWEFCDITDDEKFGLPYYIKKNCGYKALVKLERLIDWLSQQGSDFDTSYHFLKKNKKIYVDEKGH